MLLQISKFLPLGKIFEKFPKGILPESTHRHCPHITSYKHSEIGNNDEYKVIKACRVELSPTCFRSHKYCLAWRKLAIQYNYE